MELTRDINALPALLLGSGAALCVTVLLLRRLILAEKLARRRQHIAREYAVDVFELTRVGGVMDRTPPEAEGSITLRELWERVSERGHLLSRRPCLWTRKDNCGDNSVAI